MSILVDRSTRLIVQGITGRFGAYYSKKMMEAGTRIVAGVTPSKGGSAVNGLPVYDTLAEALAEHPAEATIVFAPPPVAKDALLEVIDANVRVVICIVDGIPVRDMLIVKRRLRSSPTVLIGPNCPGIITPEEFVVNLVSLCIFPFAGRPLITALLGLDDRGFEKLMRRRRRELPQFFMRALRP